MQSRHDKITLRPLTDDDNEDLARLANNKKIFES